MSNIYNQAWIFVEFVQFISFSEAYQKTVDHFGGLDLVINGAAISQEDNFEKTIEVNVVSYNYSYDI